MRTALGWLQAGLLWGLAQGAGAVEILESRVFTDDGHYLIHLDARLDAPVWRIRALLTDYPNLHRLSPTILESELLLADPPHYRIRLLSEGCVGFFCRRLEQVQAIREWRDDFIEVIDEPGRSDFRIGRAVWRIRADQEKTRLQYNGDFVPDFWIPPLLGPPLFRARLERETRRLFDRLERLAREPRLPQ